MSAQQLMLSDECRFYCSLLQNLQMRLKLAFLAKPEPKGWNSHPWMRTGPSNHHLQQPWPVPQKQLMKNRDTFIVAFQKA